VKSKFEEYESENIVGSVKGSSQSDSTIIICGECSGDRPLAE